MTSIFAWTTPAGKIDQNYIVKGTAAGAGKGNFSEDETTHKFTVPTGKRWNLMGGVVKPDVNATVTVTLHDENDVILGDLAYAAAGTSRVHYPERGTDEAMSDWFFVVMKAGWYVKIVFGANQAATAYVTCMVLEIDV